MFQQLALKFFMVWVGLGIAAPTVFAQNAPAHITLSPEAFKLDDGFAELVKAVKPAVVNISVTRNTNSSSSPNSGQQIPRRNDPFDELFREFFNFRSAPEFRSAPRRSYNTTAVGSGFIIAADGLVVTNHHVIDQAEAIEVVFDDGTRVPAQVRGTDEKTDLALLKIDRQDLTYVAFGDSDAAEVGDWVIAIGNPFGLGGTTTSGIISARGRDLHSGPLDDFIQIDASINRGNSGGPLFNTRGEVIGINSAIYSPNGGSVGIGFAIPAAIANNVITQLLNTGRVDRSYLGVHYGPVTADIAEVLDLEDEIGALISKVITDSPAKKGGLQSGDIIRKYDGKLLKQLPDLSKWVARTAKDTRVELEIWREGRIKTVTVTIGSLADSTPTKPPAKKPTSPKTSLGFTLAPIDADTIREFDLTADTTGVIITAVAPQSLAAQHGLKAGDVITRANSKSVTTPKEVSNIIEQSRKQGRKKLLLLVVTGEQAIHVTLPIDL